MQKYPYYPNRRSQRNKIRTRNKEQKSLDCSFQSQIKTNRNDQTTIVNSRYSDRKAVEFSNKKPRMYKSLITNNQDDDSDADVQQVTDVNFISEPNINDQDMDKLTEVIKKLVLKNKLNAKNAFDVPIIDVNSLGAITKNDDTAWSKISSVLENSSKVYSFRVDFIADSVNKMTNNISRSQKTHQIQLAQKLRSAKFKNRAQSELMSNQLSSFIQEQPTNQPYMKHLQKDKINQQAQKNTSCNPFHNSIRRMFDQNGISGILLARLNITPKLNIVVDATIEYEKVTNQQNNKYKSLVQAAKSQQLKKLSIFQQICQFQNIYVNPQERKQVIQDCFNLKFEDQPQICLFDNADIGLQQDFFHQTMRDSQAIQSIGKISQQLRQELNADLQDSLNISHLTRFSIVIQPFDFFQQDNLNPKKRKKPAQKPNKQARIRKPRTKKQQQVIDFNQDMSMDRKSILSNSLTEYKGQNKRRPKTKQKNIIKKIIPGFSIQMQTNYAPIIKEQHKQATDIGQYYNVSTIQPLFRQQATENNFSNMTLQDNLLRMPNIKTTKKYLWEIIQKQPNTTISKLHQTYERQKGPVSETIIFLSVLHLGNQKNLQIIQCQNYQIQVNNPNAIIQ